jgi:hypothetical protein
MKTIFEMPACFCKKADSSHFWLVVPRGLLSFKGGHERLAVESGAVREDVKL